MRATSDGIVGGQKLGGVLFLPTSDFKHYANPRLHPYEHLLNHQIKDVELVQKILDHILAPKPYWVQIEYNGEHWKVEDKTGIYESTDTPSDEPSTFSPLINTLDSRMCNSLDDILGVIKETWDASAAGTQ